jgi:chromosome segregation ATPase
MRTLTSALVALTLSAAGGCKQSTDPDAAPSAQKQIEQAQEEAAQAYERAKQAQEQAAAEAREAARARDEVNERKQELSDAEAEAARSQQDAQAAQDQARIQSDAAHAEARAAQARAAELQTRARGSRTVPPDEVVTPNTTDYDLDVDINSDVGTRDEMDRIQSQIDAAVDRIKYGAEVAREVMENAGERLDDKLDRYRE